MTAVNSRRSYSSPTRERAARETRGRIVAAARELFLTRGYGATALADIAEEAQVARPTVFAAFGSKAALLREVLDQALAGDDDPVPVRDRPWFQPVWQSRSHRRALDAYAVVCTLIGERAARTFEAVRRAAGSSPDAAELWSDLQRNRRAGARMVIEHMSEIRRLPVQTEVAVDVLCVYNDPGLYGTLVIDCGWPKTRFTPWLAAAMRRGLDAP